VKALRVSFGNVRVSTNDKDQNPETQLRPLREHAAGLAGAVVAGELSTRPEPTTSAAGARGGASSSWP